MQIKTSDTLSLMFFLLFFALLLFSVWIGRRDAASLKDSQDYFLGGRSLGFFSLIGSFLATQLGGGTLLGAAEEAYQKGYLVFLFPLGTCLGFLVLAGGFGARLRKRNLHTLAEILQKHYGSSSLRILASCLSILSLFILFIAQGVAARKFFLSIGMGSYLFPLSWGLLIAYTSMGGLLTVVKTDLLQVSFILLSFLLLVGSSLPLIDAWALPSPQWGEIPWLSWLVLPFLFMLIGQDMSQRCFAARKSTNIAAAAGGAALLLFFATSLPIYIGMLARQLGLVIPEGASVLVSSLQQLSPPFVLTCIYCAILMAIISTADSLLSAMSTNFCCDFSPTLKKVKYAQGITLFLGLIGLWGAYLPISIVELILLAYELSVSLLFVPTVAAVFLTTKNNKAAWSAVCGGALGMLIVRLWDLPFAFPKEIFPLLLSASAFFLFPSGGARAQESKV